jgi:cell division transport system permease protein
MKAPAESAQVIEAPSALNRWVQGHVQGFIGAAAALLHRPFSTLVTALVIGLTLVLPMTLHLAVGNLGRLGYAWESATQATLFLREGVDAARGQALADELVLRPGVASAVYLSADAALQEFRERSGFGEALDALQGNPLPASVVVTPQRDLTRGAIDRLMTELAALPEVDQLRRDQRWLERLFGILDLLRTAAALLAVLLGLAAAMTIANVVRLDLESRRDEVRVLKLVGAPDSFIRRPYLYSGFWYGLIGGFAALLLTAAAMALMTAPVARLAGLYGSDFALQGPDLKAILLLIGSGVALGVAAAWISLSQQLRRIEP